VAETDFVGLQKMGEAERGDPLLTVEEFREMAPNASSGRGDEQISSVIAAMTAWCEYVLETRHQCKTHKVVAGNRHCDIINGQ